MFMSTKTITIMEDAYEMLVRNKKEDESFSDVIRRIVPKNEISSFAGAWSISSKEAEDMKTYVMEMRKKGKNSILKKVQKI